MSLRWFIEKEDGSGYLMPIGANCQNIASVYEKTAGTPFWGTDNPPFVFQFTGVATNQNASPTVAQVQSAIAAFQDFMVTNDKIVKVRLRDVSGSTSPMGGTAASASGTEVSDYDPAFTGAGWEIVNFEVREIVDTQNFSFMVTIANLYPNTAGQEETIDTGAALSAADFSTERSISNGMIRTTVSATLKLRKRGQIQSALSVAIGLANGGNNNAAELFKRGDNAVAGADKQLIFNGDLAVGSNIEGISVSYEPVGMMFSCTVVGVKPTDRAEQFTEITHMSITATVDTDEGLVASPLKALQRFVGLAFQRTQSRKLSMDVNIRLIGFRSVSDVDRVQTQFSAILDTMDFGNFVNMGGGWGRSTGVVTGLEGGDTESGNIWTRSLHFVGAETEIDPGTSIPKKQRVSLESEALAVLSKVSLAAFLSQGDTTTQPILDLGANNGS